MHKRRRVWSVDLTCLLAVDDDVSPQELEASIDEAIAEIPGVRAYNPTHLLVQSAAEDAICCDVCGAPIVRETRVSGVVRATIGMASGVTEDSEFHGEQEVTFACSADPSHQLSSNTENLLRMPSEIELDASE